MSRFIGTFQSYIETPQSIDDFPSGLFSLAYWFRLDAWTPAYSEATMMFIGDDLGSPDTCFSHRIDGGAVSTLRLQCQWEGPGGMNAWRWNTSHPVTPGNNCLLVFSGLNKGAMEVQPIAYINGVVAPFFQQDGFGSGPANSGSNMKFFQGGDAFASAQGFQGDLWSIGVFDGALSQAQVTDMYTNRRHWECIVPAASRVFHYKYENDDPLREEVSGSTAGFLTSGTVTTTTPDPEVLSCPSAGVLLDGIVHVRTNLLGTLQTASTLRGAVAALTDGIGTLRTPLLLDGVTDVRTDASGNLNTLQTFVGDVAVLTDGIGTLTAQAGYVGDVTARTFGSGSLSTPLLLQGKVEELSDAFGLLRRLIELKGATEVRTDIGGDLRTTGAVELKGTVAVLTDLLGIDTLRLRGVTDSRTSGWGVLSTQQAIILVGFTWVQSAVTGQLRINRLLKSIPGGVATDASGPLTVERKLQGELRAGTFAFGNLFTGLGDAPIVAEGVTAVPRTVEGNVIVRQAFVTQRST